jgi:hypothetical protein
MSDLSEYQSSELVEESNNIKDELAEESNNIKDEFEEEINGKTEGLTNIDKISMELLMNNHLFTKYLSKVDSNKYDELMLYRKKIRDYKHDIMTMTDQLLRDPDAQFNNEIRESFHNYIKSSINYLENQNQPEKSTKDPYSDDSDEDILFDEKYMNDSTSSVDNPEQPFPKSFWSEKCSFSTTNDRGSEASGVVWGKQVHKQPDLTNLVVIPLSKSVVENRRSSLLSNRNKSLQNDIRAFSTRK